MDILKWTKTWLTPRKMIENERKRVLDFPDKPDFSDWLGNRKYPLDWMIKQFGNTLTERTAEEVYADNLASHLPEYMINGYIICGFCQKFFELDEEFLYAYNNGEYDDAESLRACESCFKWKPPQYHDDIEQYFRD